MKGRKTTVISVRLPDTVHAILKERAKELSVSEYIKKQILHSVNQSVNTTEKLEVAGIRLEGNRIVKKTAKSLPESVPLYNPMVHRAGDKVLVQRGKKLVETIIPELDADGQPM